MIAVKNLSFAYTKEALFDDISLTITGNWTSIVGPNGAGKSTFIQLLNGSLRPTSGEILIEGQSISTLKPLEKAELYTTIYQMNPFVFPFTVLEYVTHGLYARAGKGKLTLTQKSSIQKALELTHLMSLKDRSVTTLSGGEQQRLLIATALIQQPKVIFIDEGFSALDIRFKGEMIKLIKSLSQTYGFRVISVIHDLSIAYEISDEVLLVYDNHIKGPSKPEDIMTEQVLSEVYKTKLRAEYGIQFKVQL